MVRGANLLGRIYMSCNDSIVFKYFGAEKTPSVYIGVLSATLVNKAANIKYFLLVNKIEKYVNFFATLSILIKTLRKIVELSDFFRFEGILSFRNLEKAQHP